MMSGHPNQPGMQDSTATADPFAQPELVAALSLAERDVADFFATLSPDEFALRAGDAWTPAEHLQHLNTSVSAVARGLTVPRWLLRLRFGAVRRPSRRYAELRADYLSRLGAGGGATGRFVPAREDLTGAERGTRQDEILARWQRVNARLRTAIEGWTERQLDRIRLPHPLLGRITAREMILFTIYHNQHHIAAAKKRLPRFDPPTAGR